MNRLTQALRLLALPLLALTAAAPAAAQPIDTIFPHAPASVLPLLDGNARLDLLDLYNYGLPARAENAFGGTSQLLAKRPTYLRMRMTAISDWELKIVDNGRDTLLCTVHTLREPYVHSDIAFHSISWTPLRMTLPSLALSDFLLSADPLPERTVAEWQSRLAPLPVEAHWSPDDTRLVFTLSIDKLTEAQRKEIIPYVRPRTYGWVEGRFTAVD